MSNPIYLAVDLPRLDSAVALAQKVRQHVGGLKLGLEFFCAHGHHGVHEIAKVGLPIFLDLKLHDIPNTVAAAMRGVVRLGAAITTIHASGGSAMIRAAADAAGDEAAKLGIVPPAVVAVTILTSLDQAGAGAVGFTGPVVEQVKRLAALAQDSGADGIVCSPLEVEAVRAQCGPGFKLVIPGIRPAWSEAGDQKRFLTPEEAFAKGADVLVIGRPITGAADPAAAARRINHDLGG